jgi:hypothetical protein
MRQPASVIVLFAMLAAIARAVPAQERGVDDPIAPPARGGASVVGRVMSPATNTPVRGAQVVATNERGARVATVTDQNGAYRLNQLPAGQWRVAASKSGFITWEYGQRRPFQPAPPIALTRGQFTADIPLTRGGAISGRVYDATGDSLAGLQVRVYRATIEQGSRRLKPVGIADFTDDTGTFRVYGLPPGDYYVAASLRVAPIDSVVQTTYAPTYFPGTGDLAEAQRIKLGLGAEATATFQLLPVRPTRISGTVTTGAGSPADAFLSLVSQGTELGALGTGGVTRADGTFTLADVAPGRYWLKATLRGDGPDESGAIPVTVDGNELTGLTVVTGAPAVLRGTIVADQGAVRKLSGSPSVIAYSSRDTGTVLASGDGLTFEVGNLSEPFRLEVGDLPAGWVVKEIRVSDMDVTDQPIELSANQQAPAQIIVTDRITEITGVVPIVDKTNPPAIVVFPEDSAKWNSRSRYVRRVHADASGQYLIQGLPPGDRYLAFATDYLEDYEHLDPEFLASVKERAVPFSLAQAGKLTLELEVVER